MQDRAFAVGIKLATKQWNAKTGQVQNHSQAMLLNKMIAQKKVEVDSIILKLEDAGMIKNMTAHQIRDHVVSILSPEKYVQEQPQEEPDTFLKWYDRFTERKSDRTREIYQATRRRLVAWLGEEKLAKVKFEDIKIAWLEDLQDWLAQTCQTNAISFIYAASVQ